MFWINQTPKYLTLRQMAIKLKKKPSLCLFKITGVIFFFNNALAEVVELGLHVLFV